MVDWFGNVAKHNCFGKCLVKNAWSYQQDALYLLNAVRNGYFTWKVIYMRFNPETKTFKVFTALHNGETLTPAQAQHRFGVKNLSAEVSRIRQSGFAVYSNSRTAGNGVKVTEYAIGKPSRKIVAAGYKAMAMGLV